ncbi:hypothetical protein BT96DRAFT_50340 [Gymnopus androsaceus JB14]|uniref:Vps72/YL1 N-terminal domain-containing protein n=1 Tax=Gymnopus androsaceus JB14 TaxID=1447944 RepID=A0A6A4HH64_9AGAR|nr:hypothetical protein BT96DRAFT_50340 [Gymnopus androsaceus JB14]
MAEENLFSGRSKRSTAGNRYKAVLAEFALEDLSKEDPEEDKDFIVETFEEDAFESDFESTDEEEAAAGEHDIAENEDKQARKAARTKLERTTAAAQARQKITFDPKTMAADPFISPAVPPNANAVSLSGLLSMPTQAKSSLTTMTTIRMTQPRNVRVDGRRLDKILQILSTAISSRRRLLSPESVSKIPKS